MAVTKQPTAAVTQTAALPIKVTSLTRLPRKRRRPSNGEVEGPDDHVGQATRAHNLLQRPRRHYGLSRPPPTIVRHASWPADFKLPMRRRCKRACVQECDDRYQHVNPGRPSRSRRNIWSRGSDTSTPPRIKHVCNQQCQGACSESLPSRPHCKKSFGPSVMPVSEDRND